MKDYFSKKFRNLLEGLLQKNPKRRLTLAQARSHEFFKGLNTADMLLYKVKAPIKPKIKSNLDVKHFDQKIIQQDIMALTSTTMNSNKASTFRHKEIFQDFTYNGESDGHHRLSGALKGMQPSPNTLREQDFEDEGKKTGHVKSFLQSYSASRHSVIIEEDENSHLTTSRIPTSHVVS
mmetsp:Transcript_27851/g.42130  ORF Transcript_27851/g.42130 Transcript_27851/m.42130 type:complete len:178 (+) Transcript_27851:812-1345(+)